MSVEGLGLRTREHDIPEGVAAVYSLVSDPDTERVLGDLLADHESYSLADDGRPVTEAAFDICVIDRDGLAEHGTELLEVRSEADPVLVPVLLLSDRRSGGVETDRGPIDDSPFGSAVDELVTLRRGTTELEWRLRTLLRLRDQSRELRSQTKQLRRFREAVEASGHAIFITDPEGTIEYVNPAFEEITGYNRAEVVGRTPNILNSGKMSLEYYENLWETITSGSAWRGEIVDRRKDGKLYTAYQTIAPITDDAGEVSAFVAVQTDITERKELRDRLGRYRDIVQRLEDPIMLQDESGSFEIVNEALADFAGLPKTELLGSDERLFMDEETAETIDRKKNEVVETETAARYTVSPSFERSGREATFATSRYPYYDGDDELAGTIAICRDVTELEERTRQLQVIDNILRHNLRNDLTVIRGLADQIRTRASGDPAETAEAIVSHTDGLMSTGEKSRAITDLLSEEPKRKAIDVTASVRSVAREFDEARPDLRIDVDAADGVIASTTLKIRAAIEELVRNAVVHSDREDPTVQLSIETDETENAARIRVVDNGPGISAMDRAVLETGRATDDLYHGSGLGLWLVYWIVTRSDGSIGVENADPRGTAITIELPAADLDEAE